jgi:hypothetical protein
MYLQAFGFLLFKLIAKKPLRIIRNSLIMFSAAAWVIFKKSLTPRSAENSGELNFKKNDLDGKVPNAKSVCSTLACHSSYL